MLWLVMLAVLALSGKGKVAPAERPKYEPPEVDPPNVASGRGMLVSYAQQGDLTDEQIRFLVFVAYGESRIKNLVARGDPGLVPAGIKVNAAQNDADKARKAYESREHKFAACGHPASDYEFGSGGLFQFLPVYALLQFDAPELVCASPFEVFDPAFSIAAAYGFARGLTRRNEYLGTVASLRSGWGLPSKIGDTERIAAKTPKWTKHLKALGEPASYLDATAPAFPDRDLADLYRQMGGRL